MKQQQQEKKSCKRRQSKRKSSSRALWTTDPKGRLPRLLLRSMLGACYNLMCGFVDTF